MIAAFEGLLAGAAHVLSGPDHLFGVAPIAADPRRPVAPWLVGASWGCGHGVGVVILGIAGQSVLSLAELELASIWAERLVGLVLIVLGTQALVNARHLARPDGGAEHAKAAHHANGSGSSRALHRDAFGIGVVHGLAGAGHFWAVLPSLAMSAATATLYIASHLVATVASMVLFGWVIGRFRHAVARERTTLLLSSLGLVTIAVGTVWFGLAWA